MNNIIQVVNQHAKLLDTVGLQLGQVPKKHEIGEMFDILSHTFHYDRVLQFQGQDPLYPQPRSAYISD